MPAHFAALIETCKKYESNHPSELAKVGAARTLRELMEKADRNEVSVDEVNKHVMSKLSNPADPIFKAFFQSDLEKIFESVRDSINEKKVMSVHVTALGINYPCYSSFEKID